MTSKIKVDNINKVSDDSNIIKKCGTTITLGASGDSIALASGASQTGFGRTGTVDWQTAIKTGDFTATSGEGYFVNTTSGAITVTLPASPSVGDIVAIKDYAQTFDTNNCTVGRNSQPIEGQTFNLILNTEGVAITLIYGDATKGWQSVNSNEVTNGPLFVTATGGTITTSGNFKIHTFTGPGTFCVSCKGNPAGSGTVDYLVIAGGGGGGTGSGSYNNCGEGGGGGAGGYRESSGAASGCYTRSPLGACVAALPVSAQAYPIVVGAGASGQSGGTSTTGNKGSCSSFSTITSAGGGGGQGRNTPGSPTSPIPAAPTTGQRASGGSGGGAGNADCAPTSLHFGSGNTPPVSPSQGNPGGASAWPSPGSGDGYSSGGGGGGGATTVGANAPSINAGGNGGAGATSCITASPVARAGGGGGASRNPGTAGSGGPGGGGNGSVGNGGGGCGTANTGGGGGGAGGNRAGRSGGSGIVIIRYKFQ